MAGVPLTTSLLYVLVFSCASCVGKEDSCSMSQGQGSSPQRPRGVQCELNYPPQPPPLPHPALRAAGRAGTQGRAALMCITFVWDVANSTTADSLGGLILLPAVGVEHSIPSPRSGRFLRLYGVRGRFLRNLRAYFSDDAPTFKREILRP